MTLPPLFSTDTPDPNNSDSLTTAWLQLVDCIIHDLRTPLSGMSIMGGVLAKIFPELTKGYRLATTHNLLTSTIDERRLTLLEQEGFDSIAKDVTRALDFLQSIHDHTEQLRLESFELKPFSIKTCVDQLLKKYPFDNEKERALVHTDFNDNFTLNYVPIFIEELLTTLLRTTLYHIQHAHHGEINLWSEEDDHFYTLHFKDTLGNMSEDASSAMFDRFFSKQEDKKITPGLGLCRLALLLQGGDILCSFIKGKYTDFSIKFPKELIVRELS